MRTISNKALKEWAVVVKALDQGWQIFILRKGGIVEKEGEFILEEKEFFLFPTYEHQSEEDLKLGYHKLLGDTQSSKPDEGIVVISNYAVVDDIALVKNRGTLFRLGEFGLWSDKFLNYRFEHNPKAPLYAITLRVYRLPAARSVEMTDSYRGCLSWVDLEEGITTSGASPALSDEEYRVKADVIARILKG